MAERFGDGVAEARVGGPACELARRSGWLDLLVVGSRSYGPARRLLLGSTSTRLVHESAYRLLILPRGVHPSTADEGITAAAAP
jgi:nucleotide-binding universal stress UspA family protein